MVTATDLMGLGLSPFVAGRLATTPTPFTASGASQASAAQVGPLQQLIYVNASNSGSGVKLPQIGGANGCLLGDDFTLLNLLAGTVQVYTASAVTGTIYITGASTTGVTGVGIDPGFQAIFQCVTPSTWICIKASA